MDIPTIAELLEDVASWLHLDYGEMILTRSRTSTSSMDNPTIIFRFSHHGRVISYAMSYQEIELLKVPLRDVLVSVAVQVAPPAAEPGAERSE